MAAALPTWARLTEGMDLHVSRNIWANASFCSAEISLLGWNSTICASISVSWDQVGGCLGALGCQGGRRAVVHPADGRAAASGAGLYQRAAGLRVVYPTAACLMAVFPTLAGCLEGGLPEGGCPEGGPMTGGLTGAARTAAALTEDDCRKGDRPRLADGSTVACRLQMAD